MSMLFSLHWRFQENFSEYSDGRRPFISLAFLIKSTGQQVFYIILYLIFDRQDGNLRDR